MEGLQVGRIVHYVAYGTPGGEYPAGKRRAAIVVEVIRRLPTEIEIEPEVTLCVFNPTGMHWTKAPYSEKPVPGTWHWPERE
jgi:hypothetical protein